MNRFINYMVTNNIITNEDRELYLYGLEQGAFMLLNLVTTLIMGQITGMLWQSLLFVCVYIPLRSFAGGYHARTQTGCYLISTALVFVCMLLIKMLQETALFPVILAVSAGVVVFITAPLADANKPLQIGEFKAYKSKARKLLLLELLLFFLLYMIEFKSGATCIAVSLGLQGFMLILHKLLSNVAKPA